MTNPIGAANSASAAADAARAAALGGHISQRAAQLLDAGKQLGVLNPELLANELAQLALKDPKAAGKLLA
jgi:hypothetical protein